jgi:hypothetical protein
MRVVSFALVFLASTSVYGGTVPVSPPEPVLAVRASEPISIDGFLTETIWRRAGTRDFIQFEPDNGAAPTERTETWVAYDDDNLYVAAELSDSEPALIRSRLGRRDAAVESDWFFVALDPYFDRRSGFIFGINPAGSVTDGILANDFENDPTWDGVWEGRARITEKGWTVEIRIPLDQLRFKASEEQVWGVDFRRIVKRKNELQELVRVKKDESVYVSRFARLEGLAGLKPGPLVEIVPFSVGQAFSGPADPGNPFQTGSSLSVNAGLDAKIGLKNNLTLDATVNPDFGQIEVDPAVVNLTAFETFYDERRPFFIEGADIFQGFGVGGVAQNISLSWPRPSFFYSRRIGRTPQGRIQSPGYVDFPERTTILGAAKVSGRLGQGWNLGLIQAVTSRESAEIDDGGLRSRQEVEPMTYYGIARIQREMEEGRRAFGLMATAVVRDLENGDLAAVLNKRAFSLGADGWRFLDKNRDWVVSGWLGATRVEGSVEDILRLQSSSQHYFQRPDAGHVRVDPSATSISGWAGRFLLAKQQGRWQLNLAGGAISPGFNPNDAGYMRSGADLIDAHLFVSRQWNRPGNLFRRVYLIFGPYFTFDFGGTALDRGAHLYLSTRFANYHNIGVFLVYSPSSLNKTLTRGGPLVRLPESGYVYLTWSGDDRKPLVPQATLYHRTVRQTSREWSASAGFRWTPAENIVFSVSPAWSETLNEIQWVDRQIDASMASTYGARYVFGRLDQKSLSCEFRLNWIFTPKMSLQLYLQPFLAAGHYDRFKELAAAGTSLYNVYGEGPSGISFSDGVYTVSPDLSGAAPEFSFVNPDFNLKSLRGTLVLRWEYRPGSLIYLVWTHNRADASHPGDFQIGRDFGGLLAVPGDNVLSLKVSYRWGL